MVLTGKSPFDDASGKEAINALALAGPRWKVYDNVSAVGTTIDDATNLSPGWSVVRNCTTGGGVKLAAANSVGTILLIANLSAEFLEVYPTSADDKILGYTPGQAIGIAAGDYKLFYRITNDIWGLLTP